MQRELHTDLFGQEEKNNLETAKQSLQQAVEDKFTPAGDFERRFRVFSESFEVLCRKVESLETRFEQLNKSASMKVDRTVAMISQMQGQINQLTHELTEKIVNIAGRVNERRVHDAQIENFVERHNVMVKTFESRIMQMQKTLMEHEGKAGRFAAGLNEIRVELKRMQRVD